MSKKYKGKTCVYCCDAISTTGDHVFARQLFLKARRSDLPKVPACEACNQQKSELEHYVTAVLPFGGRHPDGAENLKNMVPKRLANNASLHASLRKGMGRLWIREKGLLVPTITVPLEWQKVEQWLVYLVKGLSGHHWKVLIGPNYTVKFLTLTSHGEVFVRQVLGRRAANRIRHDVGAGTIAYEAAQGVDNPKLSVWQFSIYGGMTLADDGTRPKQTGSKFGAIVGPNQLFDRAEIRAMWLRGEPTCS